MAISSALGVAGAVPVGSVQMYVSATPPSNWMICDGTAISRTQYANLYAIIGTKYGVGDGSTTFNIPSVSGRIPVGLTSGTPTVPTTVSSTGTSGGTALTTDNSSSLNHTHGGVVTGGSSTYGIDGGSIAHAHTVGSHTHSLTVTSNAIQFYFIIKAQ
jgi:microcystin-dependent protein